MLNKRVIKKFFIYTIIAFSIAFGISTLNLFNQDFIKIVDGQIRDKMFIVRGELPDSKNVVIIDIDERSLSKLGQWPWSRNKIAKILENLTNAGVGVIGFDIVFAEKDRSSPKKILQELNMSIEGIPDYDEILNNIIGQTPTILGYEFELENKEFVKQDEINIPALIIERHKLVGEDMLVNAKGTVLNNKELQESAYSAGFFNNIPDAGGIVRSVPLVIRYDDQLYPSLALEMLRAANGIDRIYVNYSELGVDNIQIGDFKIPTDRHGRIVVNYRGKGRTFKYISAYKIYENNFAVEDINGKVALIGTSAAGLLDLRATPFESVFPGVEVHANAMDNILTSDFLQIPNWVDGVNLIAIFVLTFVTFWLIAYTPFWMSPVVLIGMSFGVLYVGYYYLFEEGIILNTFLPLLSVVFSVLVAIFLEYVFGIKNEALIKKKFASKVSHEIMEDLLKNPETDTFAAMQKEVTVFFSDVRGFTNISEAMPNAQLLIEFLNEYMDPMTQIIIEEKGTVDKFIGDAIMAYWNAPGDVPDHAERAVVATLRQLHMLEALNEKLRKDIRFKVMLLK